MSNPQPAIKSYFFDKGYTDLTNVIRGAWTSNNEAAKDYKARIGIAWHSGDKWLRWVKAIFYIFATISMNVFGTMFFGLITILHVSILLVLMIIVYILFTVVWITDTLYITLNGIFGACPKCKEKFKIPIYECKCGRAHTRLTPGVYGILKRKCECGELLPATFFNGRPGLCHIEGYRAKCPHCDNIIRTGEAVPICIPVIGGPSVGKTCYITAVMKELIEDVCPTAGLSVRFYDNRNEVEYTQMVEKYKNGSLQTKTADLNPAAFNFFIEKIIPKRLVYLYDIAGEAFSTSDALDTQKQYEYSHGFVFIIDPLSIPEVRSSYDENSDFSAYRASVTDLDDTFDAFLMNLKRISGLTANQLSKVPCAIAINKVDAYDLESKIGIKAANALMEENKELNLKDTWAAMDYLARQFLIQNGMNNFLKSVDLNFKNNRYFSCSSLGHIQNGREFNGIRVFEPVRWIVSSIDRKLAKKFKNYDSKQWILDNRDIFGDGSRSVV